MSVIIFESYVDIIEVNPELTVVFFVHRVTQCLKQC